MSIHTHWAVFGALTPNVKVYLKSH